MKELNSVEIEEVAGGNPVLGRIGFALGFMGAFDSLTRFGEGLGNGIYDALHNHP